MEITHIQKLKSNKNFLRLCISLFEITVVCLRKYCIWHSSTEIWELFKDFTCQQSRLQSTLEIVWIYHEAAQIGQYLLVKNEISSIFGKNLFQAPLHIYVTPVIINKISLILVNVCMQSLRIRYTIIHQRKICNIGWYSYTSSIYTLPK